LRTVDPNFTTMKQEHAKLDIICNAFYNYYCFLVTYMTGVGTCKLQYFHKYVITQYLAGIAV